jgi:4-aminobutyrate aminotransferase
VGATIANTKMFPKEEGALSSTWGGGHLLDMAIGMQTIQTIKKKRLLLHIERTGEYLRKRLCETCGIENIRGLGLMNAFDLPSQSVRDKVLLDLLKRGIITLGCGPRGIRVIPPYIVTEKELDIFVETLESVLKTKGFKCVGPLKRYERCGHDHA